MAGARGQLPSHNNQGLTICTLDKLKHIGHPFFMKHPLFRDGHHQSWLKVCLHLLTILFLILTLFLLARAQEVNSNNQQRRVTRSEARLKSQQENGGIFESGFTGTNLVIFLSLAVLSLIAVRKVRSSNGASNGSIDQPKPRVKQNSSKNTSAEDRVATPGPISALSSLYSTYRIEQNVLKLVSGERYNCEVLASRAPDDRRAIEAFLSKVITSTVSSDEEIQRAREAMENYGFVARNGASLLMAPEPFERTDAARSLGEIASARALPFLLEALHDVEPIVRNHAVVSIGQLAIPSAIGPLLDRATRQPELPAHLVSKSLSACSVEVDPGIQAESYTRQTSNEEPESYEFDIRSLVASSTMEELQADDDDEQYKQFLENAFSEDVDERSNAVKSLSQYPSRSVVELLALVSQADSESCVRSLAISSLAFIDHESVFPAVLIAMADESLEVRVAAARAFSRVSFDRSGAYLNICKTADLEMLRTVGAACARAGIVTQNIERLIRYDRRQAVETFALIYLLARAHLADSVIDVIVNHSNLNIRTAAVQLLASTGETTLVERFEELLALSHLPDEVKAALVRGIEKLKQPQADKPSESKTGATDGLTTSEISLDEALSSFVSDSTDCSVDFEEQAIEAGEEKGIALYDADSTDDVRRRLNDPAAVERAGALADLARSGGDKAFDLITSALDDPSPVVRNAATHALYQLEVDPAVSFTRALREANPQRRRNIGSAIASSGLASDALSNLHRRTLKQSHAALALLFLMVRAGEIQPLLKAIEEYSSVDTRVTCVKLLALTGQLEVLPAFRRISVRSSLPNEVRSVLMEAIYQLSTQAQ